MSEQPPDVALTDANRCIVVRPERSEDGGSLPRRRWEVKAEPCWRCDIEGAYIDAAGLGLLCDEEGIPSIRCPVCNSDRAMVEEES
jgi:hypothetical protein